VRAYLLGVDALGSVERLYERGRLANEQRVERGAGQHADDRQPHVADTLRRIAAVADTQHV